VKKTYKQITFFENKKRLALLKNFKLHLEAYLNNLQGAFDGGLYENVKAGEEHKEINKLIDEVCPYIEAIPSIVDAVDENNYLTKSLIYTQNNIIDRKYFYKSLANMTERAIAIYMKDSSRAKQRTYNPFFWIALFVDYLVGLPFETLGKAGFNQKKIEASFAGKLIKCILYVFSSILLAVFGYVIIYTLVKAGYLPTF